MAEVFPPQPFFAGSIDTPFKDKTSAILD